MKKLIALMLLCAVLALTLTGCHGKTGAVAFRVPDSLDTETPIEITFWAKNDTNRAQADIYNAAIAGFHELYPNITVNLRMYTDYVMLYNDVITNIKTDTTPNVCVTYPDHIATYLEGSNVVVPLDELMADERYGLGGSELRFDGPDNGEIVEKFLSECVLNGRTYAVPYMRSTEVLYINEDFVHALGYEVPDIPTWDWVWEVAEAATKKNPDGTYALNGQKTMIPFIYKSTDNMMIQMLRQLNAEYSDDEGNIYIFNDTTRALLEDIAEHTRTGSFSTFKISSYPANFLDAGQCVFAVDSTAGSTWMGANAPLSDISAEARVEFSTVVRMVPQFDTDDPQMISQGPSVCVFNKTDPQAVLASWLFVQYLLTDEIQTAYSRTEGYVPVTTKAQQNPDYQAYLAAGGSDGKEHYSVKIDATKLLIEHTDDTFVTPVFANSASLRNAAGDMIESVVKGVLRKKDMDDAYYEKLYSNMTALYHLEAEALGEMPLTSKALLFTLLGIWVLIGVYVARERLRARKKK